VRIVWSFGLLALAAPSFVALFCLRSKRWKHVAISIIRINLLLLTLLALDIETKRFLTDFPAMIADDTVDRDS
jgi:hypothetical protein